MKKYLLITIFLTNFLEIKPLKNYFSQSFMQTRPVYFNVAAYQAFWSSTAYFNENKTLSMQLISFFQKSVNSAYKNKSKKISEYFLIEDRSTLLVKGDKHPEDRDVRAEWLELPNNFKGIFSLLPEQKQFALFFDLKQDIKQFCNVNFFESIWLGASVAINFVENKLNLHQEIINSSDNKTIIEAINRDDIFFGKMFNHGKSFGFSELRLRIGIEFPPAESLLVYAQSYLLFPLAPSQSAKKLFDAIRGFNGHFGWGVIVNFQFPINNKCNSYEIRFCFDIENLYLFKDNQFRILELENKQWSKYLLFNNKNGRTNIPAINILTQNVEVKPFNFVDLSTGFRFSKGSFQAELTYGLWAHGSEELELKSFPNGFGIAAAPNEFTTDGIPATASKSTISHQAEPDKNDKDQNIFVEIQKDNIDLSSGGSRATITSRFNTALGYVYCGEHINAFWGLGLYIEIPDNNAALQQWGCWFKMGVSF